jgi:hypothetical protein
MEVLCKIFTYKFMAKFSFFEKNTSFFTWYRISLLLIKVHYFRIIFLQNLLIMSRHAAEIFKSAFTFWDASWSAALKGTNMQEKNLIGGGMLQVDSIHTFFKMSVPAMKAHTGLRQANGIRCAEFIVIVLRRTVVRSSLDIYGMCMPVLPGWVVAVWIAWSLVRIRIVCHFFYNDTLYYFILYRFQKFSTHFPFNTYHGSELLYNNNTTILISEHTKIHIALLHHLSWIIFK